MMTTGKLVEKQGRNTTGLKDDHPMPAGLPVRDRSRTVGSTSSVTPCFSRSLLTGKDAQCVRLWPYCQRWNRGNRHEQRTLFIETLAVSTGGRSAGRAGEQGGGSRQVCIVGRSGRKKTNEDEGRGKHKAGSADQSVAVDSLRYSVRQGQFGRGYCQTPGAPE